MKQHNNKKSTRLLAAALILTLLFGSLLSGCRKTEGTVPTVPAAAPETYAPGHTAEPTRTEPTTTAPNGDGPVVVPLKYAVDGYRLQDYDLGFLQLENKAENMVCSPLSIKYALGMLNEGTAGDTHKQIADLIGTYTPKAYRNSDRLSFANAMFVRDSYQASVKQSYLDALTEKYRADVRFDPFTGADAINAWVKDKTLGLIDALAQDSDVTPLNFALVNALAIDMDWNQKFLSNIYSRSYPHEHYWQYFAENVMPSRFANMDEPISGMMIAATVNNYDVVREIGEEEIRQTVGDAFDQYMEENPSSWYLEGDGTYEEKKAAYLDDYIREIGENYHVTDASTEFSLYVDDEVKAFAKDLKESDGTTLRYVAIMPQSGDLAGYLETADAAKINGTISQLRELKSENFPEGVVTRITGFIPKFKFDYSLDLQNDLARMGVTDVFDPEKADLSGITDGPAFVGAALHKATIEFTQDGIKAAAATMIGGAGAGEDFDYFYDVPVEEIDMTFDKPYLFFVQDKDTGEVWFAGTVYQPLKWEDEPENHAENFFPQEYDYENYSWEGTRN